APSGDQGTWKALGELSSIGLALVVATVIGLVGGYSADRLLGTSTWLLLLGLALGIAAGFVNLFRSVNRADREFDDTKGVDDAGDARHVRRRGRARRARLVARGRVDRPGCAGGRRPRGRQLPLARRARGHRERRRRSVGRRVGARRRAPVHRVRRYVRNPPRLRLGASGRAR